MAAADAGAGQRQRRQQRGAGRCQQQRDDAKPFHQRAGHQQQPLHRRRTAAQRSRAEPPGHKRRCRLRHINQAGHPGHVGQGIAPGFHQPAGQPGNQEIQAITPAELISRVHPEGRLPHHAEQPSFAAIIAARRRQRHLWQPAHHQQPGQQPQQGGSAHHQKHRPPAKGRLQQPASQGAHHRPQRQPHRHHGDCARL